MSRILSTEGGRTRTTARNIHPFEDDDVAAGKFLRKASDLLQAAEAMLAARNLNAAGVLAVQAGANAINAIFAGYHWGLVYERPCPELLRLFAGTKHPRQAQLTSRLTELLGQKTRIEYGEKTISVKETKRVLELAVEILDGAREMIG
jgi:hypothetical protein